MVAFYSIKLLLNLKDSALIGKFWDAFEEDVSKARNSYELNTTLEYVLPTDLKFLCVLDSTSGKKEVPATNGFYDELKFYQTNFENIFLYPPSGLDKSAGRNIEFLNVPKITSSQNPYCIQIKKGKLKLKMSKPSGEGLVIISRA
ncbi:MAG: hypothetical protein D6707_04735 [Bacteroidetes bacterium]|nr:MAG: hypothetical protein D6707_04735 [Bacteroidota bacterium]